jgi:hypothetical protein
MVLTLSYRERTQAGFAADLLRLLIALNASFAASDHPFTRHFMAKYVGNDLHVPSSDVLSGRVLNEETEKITNSWRQATDGEYGCGQSDGWKNIARRNLVSVIIVILGIVRMQRTFILFRTDESEIRHTF